VYVIEKFCRPLCGPGFPYFMSLKLAPSLHSDRSKFVIRYALCMSQYVWRLHCIAIIMALRWVFNCNTSAEAEERAIGSHSFRVEPGALPYLKGDNTLAKQVDDAGRDRCASNRHYCTSVWFYLVLCAHWAAIWTTSALAVESRKPEAKASRFV